MRVAGAGALPLFMSLCKRIVRALRNRRLCFALQRSVESAGSMSKHLRPWGVCMADLVLVDFFL